MASIGQFGTINTSGNILTAQINAGQINTTGNVITTGLISNNVTVNGDITTSGNITTSGIITSSGTLGIGYATGAGGSVTQVTNKGSTVTLNKVTGLITMEGTSNIAANATTVTSFVMNNSTIASTDLVEIRHVSGGSMAAYNITTSAGAGNVTIYIRNVTQSILAEAPVLRFAVIKSSNT